VTNPAIRLATLAMFSMALAAAPPSVPAFAAGGGGDPPSLVTPPPENTKQTKAPGTRTTQKAKKKDKQSSLGDPAFVEGYRAAYATIYDRNEYADAIVQLKALGHDDHPNVANLIGYSYRKLGDYKLAQAWYERALKADPNHVLTWQYYGLWQIEQGNRDQAQYHLNRIAAICGTDCAEYRSLAEALEIPPGAGLVY
jgi:tetratricopeptide (TPR) repeat protein